MKLKQHRLLDHVKRKCGFTSDTHMARELNFERVNISLVRSGKRTVSDSIILRLHEYSGEPIAVLRELAGMPPFILRWKH
jgi:plasmid maintenance system antidote protein VapI